MNQFQITKTVLKFLKLAFFTLLKQSLTLAIKRHNTRIPTETKLTNENGLWNCSCISDTCAIFMLKIDILNGMGHTLDSYKVKGNKILYFDFNKKKKHSSIGCQTDI